MSIDNKPPRASADGPPPDPLLIAYRVSESPALRLVPAARERDWMDSTRHHFANRCLPLLLANQGGWFILNSGRVATVWDGGPDLSSTSVSADSASHECPVTSHFGHGIITWCIPWLFRTPSGYNLLVRGPSNWPKDGACPLEGTVETDWSVATFTMNWQLTRKEHPVVFEEGEPIAMLVPQRRGELETFRPVERDLYADPSLSQAYLAWSQGRAEFLRELQVPDSAARRQRWQKDYALGQFPDGRLAPEHQPKRCLQSFRRDDDREGSRSQRP